MQCFILWLFWIKWQGLGDTKGLMLNFSVRKNLNLGRIPIRFFESHSYLTGVSADKLQRHLSNINMLLNNVLIILNKTVTECWQTLGGLISINTTWSHFAKQSLLLFKVMYVVYPWSNQDFVLVSSPMSTVQGSGNCQIQMSVTCWLFVDS